MLNMIPSLPKIKAIYGLTYIQACADCRERDRERERDIIILKATFYLL